MRCGSSNFKRTLWVLVLAGLTSCTREVTTAPPLAEAAAEDRECTDPSPWTDFTRVALRQSSPDSPEIVEWHALFDREAVDASIDVDVHKSTEPMTGTVALIGGRIMLSKGLTLKPGTEMDALDEPVLRMNLVRIILSRIFPSGPVGLSGEQRVERTDPVAVKNATASANIYIPGPWHVSGTATKLTDDRVTFDLTLTFPTGASAEASRTMLMSGELSMNDRPVFRDDDSLVGWTIYGIGPQETEQEASTIFDYGARSDHQARYKTIGDIRAFIAAENDPGFRDDSQDFTGFWKRKCVDAWGIQIMHSGDDGKYSIVFCGPGGCGDASEGRLSFITGDKHFEVVSQDEIIQIGQSGGRDTLYRCTKDTHPLLKY